MSFFCKKLMMMKTQPFPMWNMYVFGKNDDPHSLTFMILMVVVVSTSVTASMKKNSRLEFYLLKEHIKRKSLVVRKKIKWENFYIFVWRTTHRYSFWYLILQFMLRDKRIVQNINKLPFFRLEMTGNFDLLSCVWCFDFLITPLKSCSPKSECGHVEPNAKFTWQIFLQSFGHLVVLHIKGKTCWFVRWITMSFTSSIMIARWKKSF